MRREIKKQFKYEYTWYENKWLIFNFFRKIRHIGRFINFLRSYHFQSIAAVYMIERGYCGSCENKCEECGTEWNDYIIKCPMCGKLVIDDDFDNGE